MYYRSVGFCSRHRKVGWEPPDLENQVRTLADHRVVCCWGCRQDLGALAYCARDLPDGLGRWAMVLGAWGWCLFLGSLG